ncbi:MAG: hypothetical protein OEV64_05965 [Desulfobulbaceae bacterium]|nr:hypothetical protein [Desulfobulbaceae bacterium]
MKRGEELALKAMKKEFVRLSRVAAKAKEEADEATHIGTELLSIHNELVEIANSGETGKSILARLAALKKRSARAEKIRSKDLLKLLDKEMKTEMDRDALGQEISIYEFRYNLRSPGHKFFENMNTAGEIIE